MNARIKKDVRALAPMFALTMAGVIGLSILLTGHEAWQIVLTVFAGCCALLSAIIFGHEFNARTMTLLMAQPISRRRLWTEKMLVLGVALAACLGVLIVCERFVVHGEGRAENLFDAAGLGVLTVVCAFCTSPGLTLAVRNTLMGAATTFGAPGMWLGGPMLLAVLGGKLMHKSEPLFASDLENHPYAFISVAAVIYCTGQYWFGRRRFMRFEATDGPAKEITLPAKLENWLEPIVRRLLPAHSSPLASLVRKEILVHRVSFIISGFTSVLTFIAWFAWRLYPTEFSEAFTITCWVLPMVLVPILTGASSIAEERNWGTLTWQLTLPISAMRQWLVKMMVTLCTCFVLGTALPILLALIARFVARDFAGDAHMVIHTTLGWGGIYLLVFVAMVFGSSISTNGLRAIVSGLGMIVAAGTLIGLQSIGVEWAVRQAMYFINPIPVTEFLEKVGLIRIEDGYLSKPTVVTHHVLFGNAFGAAGILIAILAIVVGWFTYQNFRNGDLEPRRSRRQVVILLILACALAVPVQAFVYFFTIMD